MATSRRVNNNVPNDILNRNIIDKVFSAGPYIAVVKNNVDTTRRGRLQVFIPDLGGMENEPTMWVTVSYASPFFGAATPSSLGDDVKDNIFDMTPDTYGMWASSPDIGNFVLVTFADNDPNRGYWFACIPNTLSHYMVPALGSLPAAYVIGAKDAPQYPVSEYNETSKDADYAKFPFNRRPIHTYVMATLVKQGLEKDSIRGTITSSSHRESPSRVFGISTPGRPVTETLSVPINNTNRKRIKKRKGGHSFVMDDGDIDGKDQLIRLRTAGGHQIMMNDSEEVLYIANSEGTVWMEFDGSGKLHIYGQDTISVRTKKDLNLHADGDINMNAGGSIKMHGDKNINLEASSVTTLAASACNIQSGGVFSILAGGNILCTAPNIMMNSSPAQSVAVLTKNSLADTSGSDLGGWTSSPGALQSIVTIAPAHEPSVGVHKAQLSGAKGPNR